MSDKAKKPSSPPRTPPKIKDPAPDKKETPKTGRPKVEESKEGSKAAAAKPSTPPGDSSTTGPRSASPTTTSSLLKIFSNEEKDCHIADTVCQLIGNTPMVYISDKTNTTKAKIAMKLEGENPMASVKDRLALALVLHAEHDGLITPGKSTLVENTSGNTGIALAQIARVRNYRCILTMPETMSLERRALLKIFGAELVLTPAKYGMKGAMAKAKEICASTPDAFHCRQFETKYNALIHRETTGPEIWKQTEGKVDAVCIGVGTGGTVTGVSQFLKSKNPDIKIFAIEPDESAVISGDKPGPHGIHGIGPGFVPKTLDTSTLDGVLRVKAPDAIKRTKLLSREEGLFAGISSGAAVEAALQLGAKPEWEGKLIVTVIASFGERYLSTMVYQKTREEVAAWPVVPESDIQEMIDKEQADGATTSAEEKGE